MTSWRERCKLNFAARMKDYRRYLHTTKRSKIIGSYALILFCSIYFSCFLYYGFRKLSYSLNPVTLWRDHNQYGVPWLLIVLFAVLFWMGYIMIVTHKYNKKKEDPRNFSYSESGVYGTAGTLTEEAMADIARVDNIKVARGTIFGQLDQTTKRVVNQLEHSRYNKHTLVVGSSSSGKSYCYSIPFVLQAVRRRESLIITDPKGELYTTTVEFCRKNGYVVKRFDLDNLPYSDSWDCASEIIGDGRDPELRAQVFAHTAMANAGVGSGDIYILAGEALLKAVLLRVMLGSDFSNDPVALQTHQARGPKTLAEAYKLLLKGKDALAVEFSEAILQQYGALAARGPYATFESASENLSGNIIATVVAGLQLWQNRIVREITSANDIDLTLPGKRPCAYYVIMSDQHSTFDMLGGLFFSFAFSDLSDYAKTQPDAKCPVPVNFLLDEFANYFEIPDFDKKLATVRSRNINISVIIQDLPQLQKKYPETWGSILSNCATHLGIGFNDLETESHYSKRSGEATVEVVTTRHNEIDPLFAIGYKHNKGEGKRYVYTPDELGRLDKDKCLIAFQGHDVLEAYKFPYVDHPSAKEMVKAGLTDIPYRNLRNTRKAYMDAWTFFHDYEESWLEQYRLWELSQENGGWEERPECVTYAELMKIYIESHPEYLEEGENDWDDSMKYAESLGGYAAATNPAKCRTTRARGKKSAQLDGQQTMPGVDEPAQKLSAVTPVADDPTPEIDIASIMGAITSEAKQSAHRQRQQAAPMSDEGDKQNGTNGAAKPMKPKTQGRMTADNGASK